MVVVEVVVEVVRLGRPWGFWSRTTCWCRQHWINYCPTPSTSSWCCLEIVSARPSSATSSRQGRKVSKFNWDLDFYESSLRTITGDLICRGNPARSGFIHGRVSTALSNMRLAGRIRPTGWIQIACPSLPKFCHLNIKMLKTKSVLLISYIYTFYKTATAGPSYTKGWDVWYVMGISNKAWRDAAWWGAIGAAEQIYSS